MRRASSVSSGCRSPPPLRSPPRPRWGTQMTPDQAPMPEVWRGRLGSGLDPRARTLNDSLAVDRRLWPEELALTRAYAPALHEAGVLAPPELAALVAACDDLEADLVAGMVK